MTTRKEVEAKITHNGECLVNAVTEALGEKGSSFIYNLTMQSVLSGSSKEVHMRHVESAVTALMLVTLLARTGGIGEAECRKDLHAILDCALDLWADRMNRAGYKALSEDDQAALAGPVPESGTVSGRMDGVAHVKH